VIFLDEPTDGVDPVGRRDIREILLRLKAQGVTIFINSHLLGEIEQMCDRVSILHKGELIREGNIASLTQQRGLFTVGLAPGQVFPREAVLARGFPATQQGDLWEIQLVDGQSIDLVVDLLRSQGLSIRHLMEKRQSLEDIFLKSVTEEEDDAVRVPGARRTRNALASEAAVPVIPVGRSEQVQQPPR
jgi:ABC-2 type transport system ATP-binding protein